MKALMRKLVELAVLAAPFAVALLSAAGFTNPSNE